MIYILQCAYYTPEKYGKGGSVDMLKINIQVYQGFWGGGSTSNLEET